MRKITIPVRKSSISWDYGDIGERMEDIMTFREYLNNLNALMEAYPDMGNYVVVQYDATNDLYEDVVTYAQVGRWDPLRLEFKRGTNKANAVCI